jgi:hypothetical protein
MTEGFSTISSSIPDIKYSLGSCLNSILLRALNGEDYGGATKRKAGTCCVPFRRNQSIYVFRSQTGEKQPNTPTPHLDAAALVKTDLADLASLDEIASFRQV